MSLQKSSSMHSTGSAGGVNSASGAAHGHNAGGMRLCDVNPGHAADGSAGGGDGGGGGNTAVATLVTISPTNLLMELHDDLLANIFRSLALEHDLLALQHDFLAFFVSAQLVNRRVMNVIRNRLYAEYRAARHALAYFVPGTRIPCGAASVLPVPSPADWVETWNIFQDNMVLAPNGLQVGGIFNYDGIFSTESLEITVADDAQREFLLLIQNDYHGGSIYSPLLEAAEGIADLSMMPNNLRSAMGHLHLSVSYDSLGENEIGYYYRFIRVCADTTMQMVFNAISFVEGWILPDFNMTIGDEEIGPDVNVLGSLEMTDDTQWRPAIWWPQLSISIELVTVEPPFVQMPTTSSEGGGTDDNE